MSQAAHRKCHKQLMLNSNSQFSLRQVNHPERSNSRRGRNLKVGAKKVEYCRNQQNLDAQAPKIKIQVLNQI